MKNLIIIFGKTGVGKTTTAENLNYKLNNSVFFDGDWACCEGPNYMSEYEINFFKQKNLCNIIDNFNSCDSIKNIIITWNIIFDGLKEIIYRYIDIMNIILIELCCDKNIIHKRLKNKFILEKTNFNLFLPNTLYKFTIDTSLLTIIDVVNKIYDNLIENTKCNNF